MRLEVNGVEYKNFTNLSAELHLDALSNTFTFDAIKPENLPIPFKGGEEARVIVDGEPILTGYLEIINISYDASSHRITFQGRDRTGDVVDSMIDTIGDLRSPISLKSVIEKVLNSFGSTVKVIDNANPKLLQVAEDISSPEPGTNVFSFIEELARHRQVILTSDADGNIVIEKIPGGRADGVLQNILGANDNNILSADITYDTTERFNIYKFISSLNPVVLNKAASTKIDTLVSQKGSIIDTGIRAGRQFVAISESMFSDGSNKDRATWEANVRKARGRPYTCTVQGFRPSPDSDLWRPNRLIKIVDEFALIDAEMLINTVNFNLSSTSGRLTTLTLIEKNAYTLELEEPKSQNIGGGLF